MWTASASPSGISLENHVWSWVCGRSTTTTPTLEFPLLVLYEPREPHPDERNANVGVASSNWKNGYTIWTFHWRRCCSTKNITISAFIGNTTAEGAERFQRQKQFQRLTAGRWWSWDVMSVLGVTAMVKCTGEFGIEEQLPKIPVIWTVRKKSVMSNRPQGWIGNFIFESHPSETITLHWWTKQCERTVKSTDDFFFFFFNTRLIKVIFCQRQHWLQCHKNLGLKQPCSLPFPTVFAKTHTVVLCLCEKVWRPTQKLKLVQLVVAILWLNINFRFFSTTMFKFGSWGEPKGYSSRKMSMEWLPRETPASPHLKRISI